MSTTLTEIAAGRPGVYDLDEGTYHLDALTPEPSLSSTLARLMIERSPKHAWTASARLNPAYVRRESEAFDIGRSAHSLILGKGADIAVIHADNWTTKGARQERDDARAEGRVPMLVSQYEAAETMAATATGHLADFGVRIDRTRTELAAFAQIDDVWCRALVDYAPANPRAALIDIKTTTDASPDACIRAVTQYGYATQAAHYMETWKAATGETRGFLFAFVEKEPPFEVSVIEILDDQSNEADWFLSARDKTKTARALWSHCLRTGDWPGYERRIAVVGAHRIPHRQMGRPRPTVLRDAGSVHRSAGAPRMIPVETLHEIFRLDPETGCLFWRHRPVEHFPSRKEAARWNSRYAGTSALATPGPDGRKRGAIFKRRYPRARVVFAMWFGYWPAELVDHADGNPSNDVPSNLRPASHRQNSQNTGRRRPGTSRFCGVSRLQGRRRNPWVACGHDHNGTQRHIGVFPDEVSAARAYDAAAREWHGAFGGGSRAVRGADLKRGMVGSCGCAISDLLVKRNTTHGGSKTRLYRIWQAVKDRTGNPRASRYDYYGGRGISLCPEWNEFRVFREWALTNGYSDELSIDRRDNNGNYQPDNCRWVNQEVQVRNRRSREEWPLVKGKANGLSE